MKKQIHSAVWANAAFIAAKCALLTLLIIGFSFLESNAETFLDISANQVLQYKVNDNSLGVWTHRPAVSVLPAEYVQGSLSQKCKSCVYIAKVNELSAVDMDTLLDQPHPLIFILNRIDSSAQNGSIMNESAIETFKASVAALEKKLLSKHRKHAVFFTFNSENVEAFATRVRLDSQYRASNQTLFWNRFFDPYVAVSLPPSPLAKPLEVLHGKNYMGWITGEQSSDGTPLPIIALVAHHDAFAAVPGFANGVATNMTGVTALLEVAKAINQVYSSQTRGNFSFLFLLTDAGAFDYQGSMQWLAQADPTLVHNIKYVLCMDTLTSSSLSIVTPKDYRDAHPHVAKVLNALEKRVKEQSTLKLKFVNRKVSMTQPFRPISHHDVFTKAKLVAATLTRYDDPVHLWNRTSVLDNFLPENERIVLERWIKVISLSLLDTSFENAAAFDASTIKFDSIQSSIGNWIETASAHPRFSPNVHQSNEKKAFYTKITSVFEEFSIEHEQRSFNFSHTGFTFYDMELTVDMRTLEVHPTGAYVLTLFLSLLVSASVYIYFAGFKSLAEYIFFTNTNYKD